MRGCKEDVRGDLHHPVGFKNSRQEKKSSRTVNDVNYDS